MRPFNPLDKRNLGVSVANALLDQPLAPLPPPKFAGAGIYAIYYAGQQLPFASYHRLAATFATTPIPIYVGKAVPAGARIGGLGLDAPPGTVLGDRLREHASTIAYAPNLNLQDFYCRHLVVDDIWIPLGESLLIETFLPLWNTTIDGFGNHAPGIGRKDQKRSRWDTLHPGRGWASRQPPNSDSEQQVIALVERTLAMRYPSETQSG